MRCTLRWPDNYTDTVHAKGLFQAIPVEWGLLIAAGHFTYGHQVGAG